MKKDYFGKSLLVIALATMGATILSAWTGPTDFPPYGNVSAIVTTSATPQVKDGDLSTNGIITALNGLTVSGSSFFLGDTFFTNKVYFFTRIVPCFSQIFSHPGLISNFNCSINFIFLVNNIIVYFICYAQYFS